VTASIDVSAERTIAAPAEAIAAVMFDPTLDPSWMRALTGSELLDAAIGLGARTRRTARFLGRAIAWETVVRRFEPPTLLELDIAEGPFTGTVTYSIEPNGDASTVRIRNVGTPGQFAWMPSALTRHVMRSALAKDLAHLESVVTS
jgi:uncharacterized protein YndB with AHSA1/START domain